MRKNVEAGLWVHRFPYSRSSSKNNGQYCWNFLILYSFPIVYALISTTVGKVITCSQALYKQALIKISGTAWQDGSIYCFGRDAIVMKMHCEHSSQASPWFILAHSESRIRLLDRGISGQKGGDRAHRIVEVMQAENEWRRGCTSVDRNRQSDFLCMTLT